MSRFKHFVHALLGAVSIFVIGVVVGVLFDRSVLHRADPSIDFHSAESSLDASHENLLADLQDDLGLSSEQSSQVQAILNRHQAAVNDAWSAVHSRLEAAIDSVTAEISEVLDSEQRVQLHEWLLARHGISSSHADGEGH